MKPSDPTADDMRDFIREEFAAELREYGEHSDFPVECAIYWFANHYHSGQWSNLYSALSMSEYRPGMAECEPEPGSLDADIYNALVRRWG